MSAASEPALPSTPEADHQPGSKSALFILASKTESGADCVVLVHMVAAGRLAASVPTLTSAQSRPESSDDETDGSPIDVVRITKTPNESLMTGNVLIPTRTEIEKAFKREQFTGIPADTLRYPALHGVTALGDRFASWKSLGNR